MKIIFQPNGTAHCLYSELIDLRELGRLHVERASSIEFDEPRQVWQVRTNNGLPVFSSPSRQECLDWEQQHFN